MSVWPEAGSLQLAGDVPEPRGRIFGCGFACTQSPFGGSARGFDAMPFGAPRTSGASTTHAFASAKGVREVGVESRAPGRGAFGCLGWTRRLGPPVPVRELARRAVRRAVMRSSERDAVAGDRAPSGETDRRWGTSSAAPQRCGAIPRVLHRCPSILRDTMRRVAALLGFVRGAGRRLRPIPSLPPGCGGRTGSVAVFGLPASRTGARRPSGRMQASATSEPDTAENLCLLSALGWGDAGRGPGHRTAKRGSRPGAQETAAADTERVRSKAHGSIELLGVATPRGCKRTLQRTKALRSNRVPAVVETRRRCDAMTARGNARAVNAEPFREEGESGDALDGCWRGESFEGSSPLGKISKTPANQVSEGREADRGSETWRTP